MIKTPTEAVASNAELGPLTTDECARILSSIRYMQGIAERGEGRPIRDDETVEDFVLGYVKKLEGIKNASTAVISAFERLGSAKDVLQTLTIRSTCENAMLKLKESLSA